MTIERFMKTYASLPLKVRDEVVMVFENKPITWNVAYQEINHDTEKGKKILETLIRLGFV